jgi:hypothetical protein
MRIILCGLIAVSLLTAFCNLAFDVASWCAEANAQEAGPRTKPSINYRDPPRAYEAFSSAGWEIRVEKQLLVEAPSLGNQAVERLKQKLATLLTLVPKLAHAQLQSVTVYLMYGSAATGGGEDSGAMYYPETAPDAYPDIDPRWRNCLVIRSARNYVGLSELWSVKVILHELSHAWHLTHWPKDQPDMYAAWQNATNLGLYQNVKDDIGREFSRAYALTNPLEYFAELSCMYFANCNYPPVNRRELKLYDPVGYTLIESFWGVEGSSEPSKSIGKRQKPVAGGAGSRADDTRSNPRPQKSASTTPSKVGGSTATSAPKEYRTWTDTGDDRKFEAEFAWAASGNARLRKKDGSMVTIPIDRLSRDDQDWIRGRRR